MPLLRTLNSSLKISLSIVVATVLALILFNYYRTRVGPLIEVSELQNIVEESQSSSVEESQSSSVEESQNSSVEESQGSSVEESQSSSVEGSQSSSVEDPQSSSVEEPQSSSVEEPQSSSVEESQGTLDVNSAKNSHHDKHQIKEQKTSNDAYNNVNIFIMNFEHIDRFYGGRLSKVEQSNMSEVCLLKSGFTCSYQHTDPEVSNVLFGLAWSNLLILTETIKKYHNRGRLLSILNSEAETRLPPQRLDLLEQADIRIDYHPSSAVYVSEVCLLKPSRYPIKASERKGIVLLLSDCAFKWRTDFIGELMKHIHIDSYGRCFNNAQYHSAKGRYEEGMEIASKYRMFLQIENTITKDYITEKLTVAYGSGAIPVYWGTPEVYNWVPGNHTFIDISKYSNAEKLAEYLKSIDEDDNLFNYHTSNFDWEKTETMKKKTCSQKSYNCKLCEVVTQLRH